MVTWWREDIGEKAYSSVMSQVKIEFCLKFENVPIEFDRPFRSLGNSNGMCRMQFDLN